jgi:hypothetical protein
MDYHIGRLLVSCRTARDRWLCRITNLQMKGMRMMREDPEGFTRLKEQYDEAMRRVQGKNQTLIEREVRDL